MILTKALVVLVLALVYVRGSPLREGSEKMPPKSEIILRIKRLLQMLREKEHEPVATNHEEHAPNHSLIPQRRKMMERRRKLEALLQRNPGLRTLVKSLLEKRKTEELKMSQNDAQNCIPGLFYCRDESVNEETAQRREALKKIMHMKKQDSKKYCPPGFFYCPKQDESEPQEYRKNGLNLLDEMFPERKSHHHQSTKEMQDLDSITKLAQHQGKSQHHDVQIERIPASVRKIDESVEATKAKSKHGEKLADDLMKSLQDTEKQKTINKSADDKETNFDLKQLIELLKE